MRRKIIHDVMNDLFEIKWIILRSESFNATF